MALIEVLWAYDAWGELPHIAGGLRDHRSGRAHVLRLGTRAADKRRSDPVYRWLIVAGPAGRCAKLQLVWYTRRTIFSSFS